MSLSHRHEPACCRHARHRHVTLHRGPVRHGHVEAHRHRHAHPDGLSVERRHRGEGLLREAQVIGPERRGPHHALAVAALRHGAYVVGGAGLEPTAGGPCGAVLGELAGQPTGTGGDLDLAQRAATGSDLQQRVDRDTVAAEVGRDPQRIDLGSSVLLAARRGALRLSRRRLTGAAGEGGEGERERGDSRAAAPRHLVLPWTFEVGVTFRVAAATSTIPNPRSVGSVTSPGWRSVRVLAPVVLEDPARQRDRSERERR